MAAADLTAARVRELVNYDPATGIFTRAVARGRRPAGSALGFIDRANKYGYLRIRLDGRCYMVHRLAWLLMTGMWPKAVIDHRDGDGANNRWGNLREATKVQNAQNRHRFSGASGAPGVSRNGAGWRAVIRVNGKQRHLGTFPTVDEAAAAYRDAKSRLHSFATPLTAS